VHVLWLGSQTACGVHPVQRQIHTERASRVQRCSGYNGVHLTELSSVAKLVVAGAKVDEIGGYATLGAVTHWAAFIQWRWLPIGKSEANQAWYVHR
jgi:hypothetical protein